ncbi:hypothetical protein [Bradyrhizobium sp. AZCC 2289]|uniref:hypothetical protein n=1 Tax=Bradyrhizobium sp. AZCC 2289 TaxID=3117026 RepID=UPI002FEE9AC5
MRIGYWSSVHDKARLVVLPVVAIAGFAAWIMLPDPSDAEDQSAPVPAVIAGPAQNAAPVDPATAPTQSTEATAPADAAAPAAVATETTAPAKSPLDGLKISAQSWRRGGLGSKALVTLTLRNRNDFAVKDIEIDCAFARRDGSHLTDRKRVIGDVISMKSRKTYSGMLVGFVNINANRAKCSLVTASRI